MIKIIKKEKLAEGVTRLVLNAPLIAQKAMAGQFVILRPTEKGERIPLTIADYHRERGELTVIYQTVGRTTAELDTLGEGDSILNVAGPLGKASELEGMKKVAVIGGGLGCAIAYPQAKALHEKGADVDMIAGFRSRELIILEDEMRACAKLTIMTDDGSYGQKGLVTDALKEKILRGVSYDTVIAIGPPIMMKYVSLLTKEYGIRTIVSMNPIMIDGTGMCGGCRLTVDGKTKFACVDGPDFDGHLVDFDELMRRNATYRSDEQEQMKRFHECNLFKGIRQGEV
ncbi:MAG: sulfide/dihydroorotate dehydrogenase-like FAD/NAD-binding protein [Clostridia bacterium]|nr:sulfide/dihydroorotate dehydrogenase-like FAD/NAD-binding protein [Clostridia bacterium]